MALDSPFWVVNMVLTRSFSKKEKKKKKRMLSTVILPVLLSGTTIHRIGNKS
jgi:hypothetical protein